MSPAPDPSHGPTYESYLRIPELLGLQRPLSEPEAHDELQFIIVHQAYELWFKLMLHEVRGTIGHLMKGEVGPSLWLLGRCQKIALVLVQQIHVMETMSPARFLEFRDVLKPASGLQSAQFRCLEFLTGMKDERYLQLYPGSPESRALLEEALKAPSLWDGFLAAMRKRGLATEGPEALMKDLCRIYTDDAFLDLHQLAEAFIEFDETFRIWRTMHYLMAERMIGFKPGTGVHHTDAMHMSGGAKAGGEAKAGGCPFGHGSLPRDSEGPSFQDPGVLYLKGRADLRFFPLLWELRSHLGGGAYGG
ncbi:MAG TPA: tryptophan 2,3-dioxygenase family protein [Holophagaceae bacterium]|nr:tryptophan 2,3-dioxygenase family protein [Holophagaceae bacterium]